MRRQIKRPVVQLTSLLDLLFVMIFVSLLQTKSAPSKAKTQAKTPPASRAKPKNKQKTEPAKPAPKVVPVTAVFHFYATSRSPNVPTGTYSMRGSYDKETGDIELGGTAWINRPAGYDMVPLKGKIGNNETFTGRIDFQDCEQFTLRRTKRIPGSDIGGNWKGSYVCFQGETGLTLTIQ